MHDFHDFAIETERLYLRCVEQCDAAAVSEAMVPEIARWLSSWEVPFTCDMAEERIADARKSAKAGVMLPLALIEKVSGQFVGWVTFYRDYKDPTRGGVGYWIVCNAQGCGYLREVARPILRAVFDLLNVDVIEAGAQLENSASFGVMKAWGMKPVADRMHYAPARGREELCRYYEITRLDLMRANNR